MKLRDLSLCLFLLSAFTVAAQPRELVAPAPPLGWNSYDAYGLTVTETQFKANVDWFHQHLQPYGWQYVIIDADWYLAQPDSPGQLGYTLSDDGRFQPAVNRFPSAVNQRGFKPLADYVHSLGLRFGIHIIRGIPRKAVEKDLSIAGSPFRAADAADTSDHCRWNADTYGVKDSPAGQAYYNSIIQLYAMWGVDFLKVDCIASPYKAAEIRMIGNAIKKSGRSMVLSVSPGPTPLNEAADVQQYAQLWRISNDFWDLWTAPHDQDGFPQSLKGQFSLLAQWEQYAGPGHWPDADMLPIGYLGPHAGWGPSPRQSRLTHAEAQTLVTLWSIARSPLIVGADLTRMDPTMESLLTNPEVLSVDQSTTGNHEIVEFPHQGAAAAEDIVIWTAREGSYPIIALFNRSNATATIRLPEWTKLGNQFGLAKSRYHVRDLWLRKDLGAKTSLSVTLPPHGAALFRLSE